MLRRCVRSRNIKNRCSIYIYDISNLRVNIFLRRFVTVTPYGCSGSDVRTRRPLSCTKKFLIKAEASLEFPYGTAAISKNSYHLQTNSLADSHSLYWQSRERQQNDDFFCAVALRPNAGHGLLILDVSRSHTTTHHSR